MSIDLSKLLNKEQRKAAMDAMLTPFSWLYGSGVWIRNKAFDFGLLPQEEWQLIADFLPKYFPIPEITPELLDNLLPYMRNDKKNHDETLNFTMLDHIGHAVPDYSIDANLFPRVPLRSTLG